MVGGAKDWHPNEPVALGPSAAAQRTIRVEESIVDLPRERTGLCHFIATWFAANLPFRRGKQMTLNF